MKTDALARHGAWSRAGKVAVVFVFIALLLPMGLHTDDIGIIEGASAMGYSELWTSPFMGLFYRPVVVTLVKASQDLFGQVALPLRVLQGVLVAATVAYAGRLLRPRVSELGTWAATLCLLASPFLFIGVTTFAVGIADLMVGLCLLLAVRVVGEDERLTWQGGAKLMGLAAFAVLSKESGLLVAAYGFFAAARRRHFLLAGGMAVLAVSYLAIRAAFVESQAFAFSTGYMDAMYSPSELQARFGANPLSIYAYNVAANFLSVVFWVPHEGQLDLPLARAPMVVLTFGTALVVGWYLFQPGVARGKAELLLLVPLNALLGYMYVRPRIMYVAYLMVALLLGEGVDKLWRKPRHLLGIPSRPLLVVLLALWVYFLVKASARLLSQA